MFYIFDIIICIFTLLPEIMIDCTLALVYCNEVDVSIVHLSVVAALVLGVDAFSRNFIGFFSMGLAALLLSVYTV